MKVYKEIKLKQDSEQWHTWRNEGIGASEMSVIMGALPFKFNDVLNLWKLKTGYAESSFEMNDAMQFGKDTEPLARQKYIEATNTPVSPACYQRIDLPFIRASLDGISKNKNLVVEIKVPSVSKWRMAKQGVVLDYYIPQMQAQMACTGADTCHYWVYRPELGGVLITVDRDDFYISELLRRAKIFWAKVEARTPCLPKDLGISMREESDPFSTENMNIQLVKVFKS